MNKQNILSEIKSFLDGYNNDLKYLVNVETDPKTNIADCIIHEPNTHPKMVHIKYEPFMYMKDLSKFGIKIYEGKSETYIKSMQIKHGLAITKLKTGNQDRLINGYCYKITSTKSYNDIIEFFRNGGIDPYAKLKDNNGNNIKNDDRYVYLYREHFYNVGTNEQFFISKQVRLYKGFDEYKNIHKLIFDIETTGLRYEMSRIFAIGVKDNRNFETILEAKKKNDDESEIRLIQDFFNLINYLQPAIILGYNSEEFDFNFILGRAKILKINLEQIPTTLIKNKTIIRRPNTSVKYGNTADKYTATNMWGYSIIDTYHAAKRTAAINSDIKSVKLKEIAKYENIAKPNRIYIKGDDNGIGRFFNENKLFLIDDKNNYIKIPDNYQEIGKKLYLLQLNKKKITDDKYSIIKNEILKQSPDFVSWFRENALPKNITNFISGKKLVKRYLLDDLWETEQVDELYNQSSFMLAKIIPTTYHKICTMGTASVWNLLLTTWSYNNDIAIPISDDRDVFSGGLARCFKTGFTKRIIKIDYGSLYPMIQLSDGVFPFFDITGVIWKILIYLTTTRNIYKKLAIDDKLNNEEISLLNEIDHDSYIKYINNTLTDADRLMFKTKQLPIKILNNSLFGALGSAISFNWSDNICAARITTTGRLHLRHAISWFKEYGCEPLLAVTDGVNFQYPEKTKIRINNSEIREEDIENDINDMWKYNDKIGIGALIEKFNFEELKSDYLNVDNDGEFISCLNLSRINYATLAHVKDRKTGEIKEKVKLTGNTIKSKVMPEYIEEFIDNGLKLILHGKGKEFIDYYYDYVDDIRFMQIPLKKIASKNKLKTTIKAYQNRGNDKNGREKGMQAHMELLIKKREEIARKLFDEHIIEFNIEPNKTNTDFTYNQIIKYVEKHMPPEPELDSVIYYVNTGYRKSHGNSKIIKDKVTGEERFCSTLISNEDLIENPNMTGTYNYEKYLDAFNKRVETILVGFQPEIRNRILVKIDKNGNLKKEMFTNEELELGNFDSDNFEEAMHLEDPEVKFWNKTGYDPRLIWDGFKVHDDNKINYEIYDHALNYLNEKMIKANKPLIKSINDKYENGDMILIKNGSKYHVGLFNGIFVEIIRNDVEIPKSEFELKLEDNNKKEIEKLNNLEITLTKKTEKDIFLESEQKLKNMIFVEFKEKYNIPEHIEMEELFNSVENSFDAFTDYFLDKKNELENQNVEYIDIDIDE